MSSAKRLSAPSSEALQPSWLLEQIRDIVLLISVVDGRIVASNQAAVNAYGDAVIASPSTRIGDLVAQGEGREASPLLGGESASILADGGIFEDLHVHEDGSRFQVEVNARLGELGGVRVIVAVAREIAGRKSMDQALSAAYSEIEQIFDTAADGMRIIDRNYNVLRANRTLAEMAGVDYDAITGVKCFDVFPGSTCKTPECSLARVLRGEGKFAGEIEKRRHDGTAITCTVTAQPFVVGDKVVGVIEDFHDITERIRAEEAVAFLATHDALTGLPNRRLFADRLDRALSTARRRGGIPALLFCDVDRFKSLNDTLGHAVGDEVLVVTARALQESVRDSDTVARLGGDEFVVLLSDVKKSADAEKVAHKILNTVGRIERFGEATLGITMSIGATAYVLGDDADALMSRADEAMYRVKEYGGNGCHFIVG